MTENNEKRASQEVIQERVRDLTNAHGDLPYHTVTVNPVMTSEDAYRASSKDLEPAPTPVDIFTQTLKTVDGQEYEVTVPASRSESGREPPELRSDGPILPPGVTPLAKASLSHHTNDAVASVREGIVEGTVSHQEVQSILQVIPREVMRRLVYEYAGMGATLLMTLSKQVQMVDTVLSQLVSPDGRLKPPPAEGLGIDLKDALNLSVKCSQLILRDLPKVYNIERVQRLEMAIGEVMEKHFSTEQQGEVLKRLEELTTDKGK